MSKRKKRRANPNRVYDGQGKFFVKASSRGAAKTIARVIGGTVGKPKSNPKKKGALIFRTKTAAKKYAKNHGLTRFSLKKVARAKR
jgi:hypothetical protein